MKLSPQLKRIPVKLYNPETLLYRDRVIANSGTISDASLDAVEKFVQDCKNAMIWDKLLEVGVFAGNNLAAALAKLVVGPGATAALTNVNFIAGDYAETGSSGGLNSDGATKYLNTGFAGTTLPDTAHLSVYLRDDVAAAGNRGLLGTLTGTDQFWIGGLNASASADFRYGQLNGTTVGSGLLKGFWCGVRASSSSLRLYRNGVFADSNSTVTSLVKPAGSLFTHAYNVSGTPTAYTPGRISFYSIGNSLTDADALALHLAVRTLQYNLNRGIN